MEWNPDIPSVRIRVFSTRALSARALLLVLTLFLSLPIFFVLSPAPVSAQGFWYLTGRDHPELRWQTLETEHFRIHFHQGLEETARRAARIAEDVYVPITRQLDTHPRRKTVIVLSDRDDVVNGYASHTGQIFIWVHLNDYLSIFSGREKWLRKVIAHEFQHVVTLEAIRTWAGPMNLLFVPAWYLEGMAEYFTESWGVGRCDASVRAATLQDRLGDLDPHDSGFARVLMLAREYGDSTLVKMAKHRMRGIGLYSFEKAFHAATGRTVASFEEDWRRTMNACYYGYLGQKEGIYDVGKSLPLPLARVRAIAYSPDSTTLAVVGARAQAMRDVGLYLVSADSLRRVREVDHGLIGRRLSWAPDGRALVYARYHRGRHGSLDWDIYRLDVRRGAGAGRGAGRNEWGEARGRWLTREGRAADPCWSPDGGTLVYVSYPGQTTNLYLMDDDGANHRPLTAFNGDVQVLTPQWSPDGEWIAFTVFDETSGPDIAVVRRDGSGFRKVTADSSYDLHPLWSPTGDRIYFTSLRDGTANLFSVPFAGAGSETSSSVAAGAGEGGPGGPAPEPEQESADETAPGMAPPAGPPASEPAPLVAAERCPMTQMTDVGEGLWGVAMVPRADRVVALSLGSVDSARVVEVEGDRRAEPTALQLRAPFIEWQTKGPEISIPPEGSSTREAGDAPPGNAPSAVAGSAPEPVKIAGPRPYRFWHDPRFLGWIVLPSADGVGGAVVVNDALGRHVVALGGGVEWNGELGSCFLAYLNATQAPLLSVSLYRDTRAGLRMYERHLLAERIDGVSLGATLPLNRGDNLAAEHRFTVYLDLQERRPLDLDELELRHLPRPEAGQEGIAGLEYRWLRRRPHQANWIHPSQGAGAAARWEHASAAIFGDFTYDRAAAEVFLNQRIPHVGPVLFTRLKFEAVGGRPPAQLFTGVTPDEMLYLPPGSLASLLAGEFALRRETVRLRGWPHYWLGDRALWAVGEVRLPLAPGLPANVFGVNVGRITGALFADAASVWREGEEAARHWRSTAGVELKHEVRLGSETLFIGSWGLGQRWSEWRRGRTTEIERYFRLALVNPF